MRLRRHIDSSVLSWECPVFLCYSHLTSRRHTLELIRTSRVSQLANKSTSVEPWLDSLRIALVLSRTPSSHPWTSEGVPRDSIGLPSSHLPSLLFQGAHISFLNPWETLINSSLSIQSHTTPVLCLWLQWDKWFSLWVLVGHNYAQINDFLSRIVVKFDCDNFIYTVTFPILVWLWHAVFLQSICNFEPISTVWFWSTETKLTLINL